MEIKSNINKLIKINNNGKTNFKIYLIIIILMLFLPILAKDKIPLKRKLNFENEITITIKGNGKQFIVYEWGPTTPNRIYINGALQSTTARYINIEEGDENTETIVKMEWDSPLTSCSSLFSFLSNIISIDLSKFDSSSVKDMGSAFRGCSSLTSLNLETLDTSKVTNMAGMFYGCTNLISLNLNNFNTSLVDSMLNMFYESTNLKSINMDNFDTSKVTNIHAMFYHCSSLTTLDLSSFNTQSVTDMGNIFENCYSLISLNIKNFNTSSATSMNNMFYGCSSLISLNMQYFDSSNAVNPQHFFNNIRSDIIYCVDNNKVSSLLAQLYGQNNCSDICFTGDDIKLIENKQICIEDCKRDDFYQFEYKNLCYETCPTNTHVTSDNLYLCQNNPKGYFLDNDNIYRPCYESCKSCRAAGDQIHHNCIECKSDYRFINESGFENNCYLECSFYYYFDSIGNYICTSGYECPTDYKLIEEKNKCVYNCSNDDSYLFEFNNKCYEACPNNSYTLFDNIYLCSIDPEGYYLDNNNNIYKPCYATCKNCRSQGNSDHHNCDTCNIGYNFISDLNYENNCYPICDNYYFDELNEYHCNEKIECTELAPKYIEDKNLCIDECKNDDVYQFEYNNTCYRTCPNNTHVTSDNLYLCKNNPQGYFLDNDNIYRPCYESCKSCNIAGNETHHNCIECKPNYRLIDESKTGNDKNCYQICQYYYYFNSTGNYHCTQTSDCPKEQNKLIKSKNKCIDDCSNDDIFKYEENNICIKFSPDEGIIIICPIDLPYEKNRECVETCTSSEFLNKECKINNLDNKNAQNDIIKSIKYDLSHNNLNEIISNVLNGDKNDLIMEDNNIVYQITSSDNQNNNEYNNISSILLGDCETKLKQQNGIDENETLIIFKIDRFEEGLKIPIIEYEIYNPINLEKLDLDICNDTKIGISIPVSIDEDCLFKYNSSDAYYNDICYSYTTENGTDIVVKDRQNEFKENNMSLCESNCQYTNYNSTNKKVLCQCNYKNIINSITDIDGNKDKLLKSFKDLKNAINLEVLKCYKKFFSKEGIIKNLANYILLLIILIHIISLLAFIAKGYKSIYNTVHELKKKYKHNSGDESKKNKKSDINRNKNNTHKNTTKDNNQNKIKIFNIKQRKSKINIKKSDKIKLNPPKKKSKNKLSTKNINEETQLKSINTKLDLKDSENHRKKDNRIKQKKISFKKSEKVLNENKKSKTGELNILDFNDYELNNLIYKKALSIDRRTYTQFYWSLLKQKHALIFTFYTYNDYNSKIIKICLFIFSFALYSTVNALFFNYKTMHKIYEEQGAFNFIFQIPQILYSTLISTFINILVKTLSLTQKNILEIKNNQNSKVNEILKCLIIKFTLYFILSFIFLLFFWFYLGCFCAIYTNTQTHIFKDTAISFILSLIYPLFINLIPGLFRIPSLKSPNKSRESLYKFSLLIQLI